MNSASMASMVAGSLGSVIATLNRLAIWPASRRCAEGSDRRLRSEQRMMGRRRATYVVTALLVVACGATPAAPETPEPAAFSVAAVRQSWEDECDDDIKIDELFCEQVDLGGMTAEGDILYVPTTLNAASDERAEAICDLFTFLHFDANAVDLGFEYVGILDQDGGNLAACTVD